MIVAVSFLLASQASLCHLVCVARFCRVHNHACGILLVQLLGYISEGVESERRVTPDNRFRG